MADENMTVAGTWKCALCESDVSMHYAFCPDCSSGEVTISKDETAAVTDLILSAAPGSWAKFEALPLESREAIIRKFGIESIIVNGVRKFTRDNEIKNTCPRCSNLFDGATQYCALCTDFLDALEDVVDALPEKLGDRSLRSPGDKEHE